MYSMAQGRKISQALATQNSHNNNRLNVISDGAAATPQQAALDLRIEKQVQLV